MSSSRQFSCDRQPKRYKQLRPKPSHFAYTPINYYKSRQHITRHQEPTRSVIGRIPKPMSSSPVLRPIEADPVAPPLFQMPHNAMRPAIGPSVGSMAVVGRTQTHNKTDPNVKRIVDAYQRTLGRIHNPYDTEDLILLTYNGSLEHIYREHCQEVSQFCQSLDLLSSLPQNEMNENGKNWLEVLIIRSCWWFTYNDEDDLDVIKVGDKYGLHRNSDKALGPLFTFAETISDMGLQAIELALISTYLLLIGSSSFQKPNEPQVSMTAPRREHVLKLLYNYEMDNYPEDNMRYVRILTYLSELTFIARNT